MWDIIEDLLTDITVIIIDQFLTVLEEIFGSLISTSFFIEAFPGLSGTPLTANAVSAAMNALYGILILLLVAKLLFKGWKVYVLWRDGESETPPGEMVVGAVIAILISIAFPTLLKVCVNTVEWILDTVSDAMFGQAVSDARSLTTSVIASLAEAPSLGIVSVVCALVYIILYIVMLFVSLKQGGEMLLFRLAVPFAAVGWVDSDGGAWKPFIQAFFRQIATVLVRYFFIYLSVRLIAGGTISSLVIGIAFLVIALSTPQILAQFMVTGRGGITQKLYTVGMVLRVFKGG